MTEKKYKFDGTNNYITPIDWDNLHPISMKVKIPKEANIHTIHPIVQHGSNKLTWNQLHKHIKDEEWHHITWDSKTLQIDGKFCKL